MRSFSAGALLKRLVLVGTILFFTTGPASQAQDSKARVVRNAWEIHQELAIAPDARAAIKDYFPSFLEYHDWVMFHPKFGYYSSGRVSFTSDYRTYPVVMAPLFGHIVAEQVFFMWQGMRRAGTLADGERFTIAEFGPGDGALAESILQYLEDKSKDDARWREFANQVLYICYDRSPALNNTQRERNKRFGSRFDARVADATKPTATIQPGSLKGVVLSNELPDAFSVHKIIVSADGTAEVAYVVPKLPAANWQTIRPLLPADAVKAIEQDDVTVEKRFFSTTPDVYLTRASFVAVLENLLTSKEYDATSNAMKFQEVYIPVSLVPEVADHLRRYAPFYANVLARDPRGFVNYINLGAESFISGTAAVLKAGYMLTIDYGSTWEGILAQDSYPHFRSYGAAQKEGTHLAPNEIDTYAPYVGPTLNDMTTDVNFSLLAAEGELVGLKPLYFGSQGALHAGTSVSLDEVPQRAEREGSADEFRTWANNFLLPSVYKVFVQQKEGTDPAYQFPGKDPESLGLDRSTLTAEQLRLATEVEERIKAQAAPVR
jgi:SAM-dependent MidA family methyltransferase